MIELRDLFGTVAFTVLIFYAPDLIQKYGSLLKSCF